MSVWLTLVTVELRLPGCASLKEQRQRLGGLRDRVGKHSGFAVVQCQGSDRQHDTQVWAFAVLASDGQQLQRQLSSLEKIILNTVDGEIVKWEEQAL